MYDQKEIEGLPEPVQRFFRTVLKDGQAIVAVVKLSQQGQFNLNERNGSQVESVYCHPTCDDSTPRF
jgi:hypothetical protein